MITGLFTLGSLSIDSVSARNTADRLRQMRAQLDELGRQMSTRMASDDYAGLGPDRWRSVDLHQSLSALDGYDAAAADAALRAQTFDTVLGRMSQSATDISKALAMSGSTIGADGKYPAQSDAVTRLQEMVDLLNTSLGGRHLFAGRKADTNPVLSADQILNGYVDPLGVQRDGLKTLISERVTADFNGGDGHLTAAWSAGSSTVSLSHDATTWGFGLGAATGSANITASGAGPITFTVTNLPADGETVTVRLTLPDGTNKDIALVARAGSPTSGSGDSFAIGADTASTAQAMQQALQKAIQREAATSLKAASAAFTAKDFFTSAAPVRVNGGNTVQWYQGDPGAASDARSTAPVRVGASQSIQLGAQANETGPAQLMAAFGLLATQTFDPAVSTDPSRWSEVASRTGTLMQAGRNGVTDMRTQIGTAAASAKTATEQNSATRATLQDALAGVEQVSPEEVTVQLLTLQTRMQASYQITSMLSKLSLVNYLG